VTDAPDPPSAAAPPTAAPRRSLIAAFVAAAVVVYVLDRLTKLLAERRLVGRAPIVLLPPVLDLRYTTNSGGAFGVLGSEPWVFFTATAVVSAAIVVAAFRVTIGPGQVGLGMILGGALGNLTDRLAHGAGIAGGVTDCIHLHHWPVFNVADSCIVLGAVAVALAGARRRPERASEERTEPRRDGNAAR
jgi:signal peptidase II